MEQMCVGPEDEIIEKITLEGYISQFDPNIQTVFFDVYGKKLEAISNDLLPSNLSLERFLECLLMLKDVESQMLVLMRLGFVSGTPMTLRDVGAVLGITRERVRQIESKFIRLVRPPKRRAKRIRDFYN